MGSASWEKDNLPSSSAPTSVPETLEIELPVTLCNRILTIAASDTANNPYQDIFSEIVDAISAVTTTEDEEELTGPETADGPHQTATA